MSAKKIIGITAAATAVIVSAGALVSILVLDQDEGLQSLVKTVSTELTKDDTPYEPSGQIIGYRDELQLTDLGKQILFESKPEILSNPDFDEACSGVKVEPGVGVLGCYYSGRDKIYIYDVTDDRLVDIERVVLAHELLHAVWERMSADEQDSINQELLRVFSGLPDGNPVVVRLEPYIKSAPDTLTTELHSIMGTEAVDISSDLETHYAQYFKDRKQLAADANNAYQVIDDTRNELLKKAKALLEGGEELDFMRSRLAQREVNVESLINEFNRKADNLEFATEEEYDKARESINLERSSLAEDYEAFNRSVEKYNDDVARLEALNRALKELNEGVNIPTLHEVTK